MTITAIYFPFGIKRYYFDLAMSSANVRIAWYPFPSLRKNFKIIIDYSYQTISQSRAINDEILKRKIRCIHFVVFTVFIIFLKKINFDLYKIVFNIFYLNFFYLNSEEITENSILKF